MKRPIAFCCRRIRVQLQLSRSVWQREARYLCSLLFTLLFVSRVEQVTGISVRTQTRRQQKLRISSYLGILCTPKEERMTTCIWYLYSKVNGLILKPVPGYYWIFVLLFHCQLNLAKDERTFAHGTGTVLFGVLWKICSGHSLSFSRLYNLSD
jgi:hypothetical protein